MASSPNSAATGGYGKTVPEAESARTAPPTPVNFFHADFFLRLLLFATSVTALVVLVTSKQTKAIPVPTLPSLIILRSAKFQSSPAFIYLLVALAVTCLYSVLTLLTSASAIKSSSPSAKLLFRLVLLDALLVGVLAAATGAAGAVAYIGLKGNSHVQWNKICNVYDKYCRHIGSAVGVSLVASIVLVALVVLSSYSLYRRSC